MRPSAHGDVVHSRPIAINFGPDDNPRSSCSTAATTASCVLSMATAVRGRRRAAGRSTGRSCRRSSWLDQAAVRPEPFGQLQGNTTSRPDAAAETVRHRRSDHAVQGNGPCLGLRGHASRRARGLCFRRHRLVGNDADGPHLDVENGLPESCERHGLRRRPRGMGQAWSSPKVSRLPVTAPAPRHC